MGHWWISVHTLEYRLSDYMLTYSYVTCPYLPLCYMSTHMGTHIEGSAGEVVVLGWRGGAGRAPARR